MARELTKEEADALTTDLQAVLAKHGAEMGVLASIQLLKTDDLTPSPKEFTDGTDEGKETQKVN